MLKGISNINGNNIEFHGGKESSFDAIVFATGYKSTVNTWLKVQIKIEISFITSRLLKSPNANCCAYFLFLQIDYIFVGCRTVKACSTKMVFLRIVSPIIGKVQMGSIVLGLRGEDWLVLPWMPRILPTTSCVSWIKYLVK